jgi:ribonuclease HI
MMEPCGALPRKRLFIYLFNESEILMTNNEIELRARIEALKALPVGMQFLLYTDSQYVSGNIDRELREIG